MYKIIVVDDEIFARNTIAEYVGRLPDFECGGSFRNGAAALEYMNIHPVDIVLTDIKMPQMDGLELAEIIQERFPLCVVIIISGYSEFDYARKALTFGVSNYILKPISLKGLSETLAIEKTKLDRRISEMLLNKDLSNEDAELFFSDLVSGKITEKQELFRRFEELCLPFPAVGRKGTVISFSSPAASEMERWAYGHEKFYTAILNIIRMKLNGCYAYFLREFKKHIYLIAISGGGGKNYIYESETVLTAIKDILHFTPKDWKEVRKFDQIAELYETPLFAESSCDFSEKLGKAADNDGEDAVVAKAKRYILEHLSDDLTRNDVADAVFLDSAYFSRYFKKKTGQSFFDYLTAVRMRRATELLGTRLMIKEIYEKVGYHDRKYFCNIFRQHMGYSPSEYRRKVLNMINASEEDERNSDV